MIKKLNAMENKLWLIKKKLINYRTLGKSFCRSIFYIFTSQLLIGVLAARFGLV
jgi:hypothetical protein